MHIHTFEREIDPAFLGKRTGFVLCVRREIDGRHLEPLLGQPNAIAGFTISDSERFA